MPLRKKQDPASWLDPVFPVASKKIRFERLSGRTQAYVCQYLWSRKK